jgi:hypothetical protein
MLKCGICGQPIDRLNACIVRDMDMWHMLTGMSQIKIIRTYKKCKKCKMEKNK